MRCHYLWLRAERNEDLYPCRLPSPLAGSQNPLLFRGDGTQGYKHGLASSETLAQIPALTFTSYTTLSKLFLPL